MVLLCVTFHKSCIQFNQIILAIGLWLWLLLDHRFCQYVNATIVSHSRNHSICYNHKVFILSELSHCLVLSRVLSTQFYAIICVSDASDTSRTTNWVLSGLLKSVIERQNVNLKKHKFPSCILMPPLSPTCKIYPFCSCFYSFNDDI